MCSQLADQTSTQTPEGMGIVLFNRELVRSLAIDCFVESLHQVPPAPVEAALRRNVVKHCTIFFPTTEQFSLHMPTTTLTDQRHGDQFAVRTDRRRSWSFEERRNLFP
jgi:hypothetical protein